MKRLRLSAILGIRLAPYLLFLALGIAVAGSSQSPAKGGEEKKSETQESAGDAAKGKVVYQRNCAICHHATSSAKKIGPGLKAIYQRGKFADGRPVNDATMRAWIENGGKDMPQFKNTLRPAQIADLIAYMRAM